MKQLYLASEMAKVAKHIAAKIGDVAKLKTAFIDTAVEPESDKDWVATDREGLSQAGFHLINYTITGKTPGQLEKDLGGCDLIHVNGGNTFYLLLQMRKCGFEPFIKRQIAKGVTYTGSSAGSVIAAPDIGITRNIESEIYEPELKTFEGLNLVDFVILPHWGNQLFKDSYLNHRLEFAFKPENKIILLNDFQYVTVNDGKYEIVDIRKDK